MKVFAIVLACVVGMACGQFSGSQFSGRSLTNNLGAQVGSGSGGFRAQGGGNFGAQGGGGGNFGAQGGGGGNFGAQGGGNFGAQGGGNFGAQGGGAGFGAQGGGGSSFGGHAGSVGGSNANNGGCGFGTTRSQAVNTAQRTCGKYSANCFGQGLNKAECLGVGAFPTVVAVDPFLTQCQARAAAMFDALLRIDPDGTTMIVNRFGLPIADVEVVETAFNAVQVANQMRQQEFMMLEFERCSTCTFPIPGAFHTRAQQQGR